MVLRYSPKRPNWGRGLTLCPLPSGAAWPEETSALGLQTKKFLDPSGSVSLLRWRSAWGSQVGRPTVCSSCAQSGKKYLEFAFEIPQKLKLLALGSSILCVFWEAQLWPLAGLSSSVTLSLSSVQINTSCPRKCTIGGIFLLAVVTGKEALFFKSLLTGSFCLYNAWEACGVEVKCRWAAPGTLALGGLAIGG